MALVRPLAGSSGDGLAPALDEASMEVWRTDHEQDGASAWESWLTPNDYACLKGQKLKVVDKPSQRLSGFAGQTVVVKDAKGGGNFPIRVIRSINITSSCICNNSPRMIKYYSWIIETGITSNRQGYLIAKRSITVIRVI